MISTTKFLWWTGIWMVGLVALLISAISPLDFRIPYCTYQWARGIGTIVILVLTGFAAKHVYDRIDSPSPWYQSHFLVYTLVFWALFPPTWFFVEYTLVEHGRVELFNHELCIPHHHSEVCDGELARLKDYADFASKIWAGMFAVLAGGISLLKGKSS